MSFRPTLFRPTFFRPTNLRPEEPAATLALIGLCVGRITIAAIIVASETLTSRLSVLSAQTGAMLLSSQVMIRTQITPGIVDGACEDTL